MQLKTPPARSTVHRQIGALSHFHQRITQKAKERGAPPVLIVALGDSVTQGLAGVDQFLHDEVFHQQLKRRLEKEHPLSIFSLINAGVEGDTAAAGLERFDRDVAAHRPDLVLVGFALNDAALGGPAGLDDYAKAIETIIHRTRDQTHADLILLAPNMMLTRENEAIPGRYRHLTGRFLELQHQGMLDAYVQRLRQVAVEQTIPLADVYQAWQTLAAQGVDTTAMLANGLNHPDAHGHQLAAEVIFRTIQNCR